jgi:hypothetical protein
MTPTEALEKAAHALGAPAPSADAFVGTEHGVRYSVRIDTDDGVPHRFAVDVPMPGLASVALEPEGDFARLGKRLGLSTEIQLDDPEFDPHVYIETEVDEAVVRAYFAEKNARAAVAEIVGGGDDVHLTSEGVHAWLRTEHGFDVDRVVAVVRALIRFASALPEPLPTFSPTPAPRGWPLRLALVLHLLFWVGFGTSTAVAPYRFLLGWGMGLGVDLLLAAIAFPLLVLRFRRSSSGFESIVASSIGISLFLLPVGPTFVHLLNASLDDAPRGRAGTVASAHCGDDDGDAATAATVRVDETTYELQLAGCRELSAGEPVTVLTSPGGLGLERVHGLDIP